MPGPIRSQPAWGTARGPNRIAPEAELKASLHPARRLHPDHDFPPGMALLQVPDGLRNVAQRVGPVDDRGDLPCFKEFPDHGEIARAEAP